MVRGNNQLDNHSTYRTFGHGHVVAEGGQTGHAVEGEDEDAQEGGQELDRGRGLNAC